MFNMKIMAMFMRRNTGLEILKRYSEATRVRLHLLLIPFSYIKLGCSAMLGCTPAFRLLLLQIV